MKTFLKGILVGIGGVSPGLSGSVMMVIFGLYEKCIDMISSIFKDFKKNMIFLLPLALGMLVGIVCFGKVVSFLLDNYEIYTRFTFLGLVLGTLPLFFKEVKKKGFHNKYYFVMIIAGFIGLILLKLKTNNVPIDDLNIFQSIILGLTVAASTIIPGVDSAVILSSLGLYEIYVNSVASLNWSILIPAGIGGIVGIMIFSIVMNLLIKKHYTLIFSIIFGLFLAIIPSVLNNSCTLGFNVTSFICVILLIVGFLFSFFFSKLQKDEITLK